MNTLGKIIVSTRIPHGVNGAFLLPARKRGPLDAYGCDLRFSGFLNGCHPYTLAFCMGGRASPYKTYGGPWRAVTEISVTVDVFPLAPSLRAAGSPHLVLSTQIFLGDLSASVGILGRPNSRSPAAGASPGTALNRRSPLRPQRPPGLS